MSLIAIVQDRPVYYDLTESLKKLRLLMEQASAKKANIIAFGESWLCGYPAWLDNYPEVGRWDHEPVKELWLKHFQSAVSASGEELQDISAWAKELDLWVILGANEKLDIGRGNGSVFNSIFTISDEGEIVNHHRKLVPTYTEKLMYHHGDGAGLKVVDSPHGRIGSLVCWEHWMPMSRQVLHDAAEDIHFALWPTLADRHQLASRHYAFEGRCYVVAIGQILQYKDIPTDMTLPEGAKSDDFLLSGGSCVAGPDGQWLLQPDFETEGIIYHELPSLDLLTKERMNLAVSGHYQRRDIFDYQINMQRRDDGS